MNQFTVRGKSGAAAIHLFRHAEASSIVHPAQGFQHGPQPMNFYILSHYKNQIYVYCMVWMSKATDRKRPAARARGDSELQRSDTALLCHIIQTFLKICSSPGHTVLNWVPGPSPVLTESGGWTPGLRQAHT
jgi:hypothetical protein